MFSYVCMRWDYWEQLSTTDQTSPHRRRRHHHGHRVTGDIMYQVFRLDLGSSRLLLPALLDTPFTRAECVVPKNLAVLSIFYAKPGSPLTFLEKLPHRSLRDHHQREGLCPHHQGDASKVVRIKRASTHSLPSQSARRFAFSYVDELSLSPFVTPSLSPSNCLGVIPGISCCI